MELSDEPNLIACPTCGAQIKYKDKLAGKTGKCPKCRKSVTLPDTLPSAQIPIPMAPPPLKPEIKTTDDYLQSIEKHAIRQTEYLKGIADRVGCIFQGLMFIVVLVILGAVFRGCNEISRY